MASLVSNSPYNMSCRLHSFTSFDLNNLENSQCHLDDSLLTDF